METITTAGVKASRAPRVLRKMEVEPKMGGGVIVTHHYTNYEHQSKSHSFGKDDGERAMAHIAKHAGLEEQGGSEPEPHWTKEKE